MTDSVTVSTSIPVLTSVALDGGQSFLQTRSLRERHQKALARTVRYAPRRFSYPFVSLHATRLLGWASQSLEAGATGEPRLIVTASSVHDPDTPGGNVGSKVRHCPPCRLALRGSWAMTLAQKKDVDFLTVDCTDTWVLSVQWRQCSGDAVEQ